MQTFIHFCVVGCKNITKLTINIIKLHTNISNIVLEKIGIWTCNKPPTLIPQNTSKIECQWYDWLTSNFKQNHQYYWFNNLKLKNATNILIDFEHMTKSQTFPKRAIDLTCDKINSQKNSYSNIIDQQKSYNKHKI
jgi:hypothetical protein